MNFRRQSLAKAHIYCYCFKIILKSPAEFILIYMVIVPIRGVSRCLAEIQTMIMTVCVRVSALQPGHSGERKHQPGLDVSLLADQRHREGTFPSGCWIKPEPEQKAAA